MKTFVTDVKIGGTAASTAVRGIASRMSSTAARIDATAGKTAAIGERTGATADGRRSGRAGCYMTCSAGARVPALLTRIYPAGCLFLSGGLSAGFCKSDGFCNSGCEAIFVSVSE